ncbi:MAG: arginine repressor [Clostridia bacterium]|nr:arginine repressor [Clostridia bacterium]MBR2159759.1 arginine repressor [Clostridia bacterium]MBR2323534.1 arginine repressor [Clostridia bacterium]MBR2398146.1 arginine repressor [Clostridia bacterium]MBR2495940.1 arginine repressor [Clostridia bacterium]
MARTARQSKILEIISANAIDTQEELVLRLKLEGYSVTQATISRDIKELGLTKVLSEDGKYRYVQVDGKEQKISGKIVNMFRESVISVLSAGNLIVIKTFAGSANAAAILIDKLAMDEILGCIAGDDTLLVIVSDESAVERIKAVISEVVG